MYLDQQPYIHYPQPQRYDKRQAHYGRYPDPHPYASYNARGHVVVTQPRLGGGRMTGGYDDDDDLPPDNTNAMMSGVIVCLFCSFILGLAAIRYARKSSNTQR